MSQKSELKEVARLFFKLGSIAFGGPAAHITILYGSGYVLFAFLDAVAVGQIAPVRFAHGSSVCPCKVHVYDN